MDPIEITFEVSPEDSPAIDNAGAQNGLSAGELARRLLLAYARSISGKSGGSVQLAPDPDAGDQVVIKV